MPPRSQQRSGGLTWASVVLGSACLMLSACKRPEAEEQRDAAAKPAPVAEAATAPSVEDTDFVWELRARVLVSYVSGRDKDARVVQRHEYQSEFLTYGFAPGQPAVADFDLGDGRVVQLRVSNLKRRDGQLKFDCSIATSWFWQGVGRSAIGCKLQTPDGVHLPIHRSFPPNAGEELSLEVVGWSVLSPEEAKASALPTPRLVPPDEDWHANDGHFTPAWDATTRKPAAFVRPKP